MSKVVKRSTYPAVTNADSDIKTPQELVHIKHKITLLEYKYWILLLRAYRETYVAGEKLGPDDYVYLPMSAVTDALGYQPKTKEIENDLERIRIEKIQYNVLQKDGQPAKRGAGFISQWHVSSNRIGVVFPPVLRQAVERLDDKSSIFHLLNWNIFNSFSGKYEAVLYKLCKDYVGAGRTPKLTIEEFREYMGIAPSEYPDFKRLNQWTISGPIKRINASELSDIIVSAEFTREARRVVTVQFIVESKRQSVLDFEDHPAFKVAKIRISRALQEHYLTAKPPELIRSAILRVNEYADVKEAKGEVVNLGALYRKAIEQDWGLDFEARKKTLAEKAEKVENNPVPRTGSAIEQLRSEFEREWKAEASKEITALADEAINSYFERFQSETPRIPVVLIKSGPRKSEAFHAWLRPQLVPKPSEIGFAKWMKQREG